MNAVGLQLGTHVAQLPMTDASQNANANPAALFLLLMRVLNIRVLANAIIDAFIIAQGLPQPLELDDPQQDQAFQQVLAPLHIGVGLVAIGAQRRWVVLRFIDHLRNGNGIFDTPTWYRDYIRNFEIIHPLDLNFVGTNAAALNAINNYGLSRLLLTRTMLRFPALRSLVSEFHFANDDLANFFQNQVAGNRFRAALRDWLRDIRAMQQQTPNPLELTVCLTDQVTARSAAVEVDVRGQSVLVIAVLATATIGQVYRIG